MTQWSTTQAEEQGCRLTMHQAIDGKQYIGQRSGCMVEQRGVGHDGQWQRESLHNHVARQLLKSV